MDHEGFKLSYIVPKEGKTPYFLYTVTGMCIILEYSLTPRI